MDKHKALNHPNLTTNTEAPHNAHSFTPYPSISSRTKTQPLSVAETGAVYKKASSHHAQNGLDEFTYSEEEAQESAACQQAESVLNAAYHTTLHNNLSILVSDKNTIYAIDPQGKTTKIKELDPVTTDISFDKGQCVYFDIK